MKYHYLLLKKSLFLFIIICFNISSKGQTIKKDTLAKYSFIELHDKSYAAKPDSLKALLYAKYHLKKAIMNNDTLNIASSYYILSSINKDTLTFVNYWNKIIDNKRVNKTFIVIGNIELGDFYFQKGIKDKALRNYLNARKIALKINNDSLKFISTLRLGLIKSQNKDFNGALKLYKSSLSYYNNELKRNDRQNYGSIIVGITNTFKALKLYDSAYYYNSKLFLLAKKHKDSILSGYANYINGRILFEKKEYYSAIEFLNKSLIFINLDENYAALSNSYFLLGQSYNKFNDKKNSVKYFQKVDSLFQKTGNYYKSQKPAYSFLVSHYKNKKNDKKQLEYINKYIKVDSVLNARAKNITKNLTDNYDIPNLLAERKRIENRLKGSLSITKKWIISIATIATLLLLFLIQQIRKRKLYKKRFQQLMNPANLEQQKEKPIARKEQSIPNEIVTQILKSLDKFEKEHYYISSETTLTSLAKTFETNSKYLSQVINQQKGQSFSNYINSLRIKYTVGKLKTDARFRKYSIKAIANEVGFNTSESFSKAFYKNTGIKPSYFIKELEKK